MGSNEKQHISVLSTYIPRECGLATYSYDLFSAFNALGEFHPAKVVAVNDLESLYDYTKEVKIQIDQTNLNSYLYAADIINEYSDILHIQHEYGIFGGPSGGYIIPFLKRMHIPVVTTFHTVLSKPPKTIHKITRDIAQYSSALIVMTDAARTLLKKTYGIDKKKVHVIHHGVHDQPYMSTHLGKKKLHLDGRFVLMTFGLLNQGKGVEYVLKALPKLVKDYPELLYLIIGETHPEVRLKEGEIYRHKLMKMVQDLGLVNNVKFQNRYLALEEVLDYLQAADVYITPYIYTEQVSSGTLAYALGAGKVILSTPYVYAQELLRPKRGLLIKPRDDVSIYRKLRQVLRSEETRNTLSWNAYQLGREMVWSCVALKHAELYKQVLGITQKKEGSLLRSFLPGIRV